MGFSPCKNEPYIWMRKMSGIWEYIAVYVDDLAFAMKDPATFTKTLVCKYKYKLKGAGVISLVMMMEFYVWYLGNTLIK